MISLPLSGIRYPLMVQLFINPLSHNSTAKSFISQLLVLKPKHRPSAAECLKHPWLAKYVDRTKTLPSLVLAQSKLKRWRRGRNTSGGTSAAASASDNGSATSVQNIFLYWAKFGRV